MFFYSSYQLYKKCDETDKFSHILESVNYIKVAGGNGTILPLVYFEFGCYSGRTFSAAKIQQITCKLKTLNFMLLTLF